VEIDRLLAAAERALADATVNDLSSDSRLDLAYRAIIQAALAFSCHNAQPLFIRAPAAVPYLVGPRCRDRHQAEG